MGSWTLRLKWSTLAFLSFILVLSFYYLPLGDFLFFLGWNSMEQFPFILQKKAPEYTVHVQIIRRNIFSSKKILDLRSDDLTNKTVKMWIFFNEKKNTIQISLELGRLFDEDSWDANFDNFFLFVCLPYLK